MIKYNPQFKSDGTQNGALTSAPSDSIIFDVPGKCIWVKGVKLATSHTYTFSHDNYITLTNTPGEPEDILIGVNTTALKNAIDTTYGIVNASTNGLAPMFSTANKATASAATTYNFLGITGSTLKWYQLPWRNVRINSDSTDKLGVNSTDPLIISQGDGISVTWDSTNKKIVISNTAPDQDHNTDYTTINKGTAGSTTEVSQVKALSSAGVIFEGGTNKFKVGDGTNYFEIPITPSFAIDNKAATIGTSLTTIATIAGVDITAKIGSYATSDHTHSVKINGSTKTIAAPGGTAVDLGNYIISSGFTSSGSTSLSTWGTLKTDNGYTGVLNINDPNGGSWEIAYKGGQQFHQIDGCYYQNEGRYRVLDVSDVSNKDAALTTSLTTIATIAGTDIKAKITVEDKAATIGTSATTLATIAGVNITAKIASYSLSNHTHPLSIAADSGTSSISLAASTKYKLTAGGSTYVFTSTPDENVKLVDNNNNENVPILLKNGTGTGTITSSVRTVDGVTINPYTNSLTVSGNIFLSSGHIVSTNANGCKVLINCLTVDAGSSVYENNDTTIELLGPNPHIDFNADTTTYSDYSWRMIERTPTIMTIYGSIVMATGNITSDLIGNASTANSWKTARTLTIGNTGKSVDGSANVSWTLDEIGAATSDHTHLSITDWVRETRLSKNSSNSEIESVSGWRTNGFIEIYKFCPPSMYRTTYDRPAPYGIGFGNGSESGGIMPIGQGDKLEEIRFYGANSGPTIFTFGRLLWESTSYDSRCSNYYATYLSINSTNGNLSTSGTLTSTIATGTAPINVSSTTVCGNLNADLLDGNHASAFALAGHTHNYLSTVASINGSTHAEALKTLFTNNKANIPRNVLINYYSSAYSNGSQYFGYFLSGYDSNPYGGFFVAHYNTPYYVGISNGTFTQYQLATTSQIPTVNNASLTLQTAGTTQTTFYANDDTNRTFNVTCANIGAATSGHNHDDRYVKKTGDTMTGKLSFNISGYGWIGYADNYHGIIMRGVTSGYGTNMSITASDVVEFVEYSGIFNFKKINTSENTTIASISPSGMTILGNTVWHSGNDGSGSGLDADLLDGYHKTDLVGNLTKGSWNPRGTNLAMDWYYNGGDMSISETNGQISISIDGMFYQREGAYRCLDTADNVAWQQAANDFVFASNEVTWIPSGYRGGLYINYRTTGGMNGGLTEYIFLNGAGSCANITAAHFYESSDARLKRDIISVSKSVKQFKFHNDERIYYGFIALELEILHPELVDSSKEYKTVNYDSAICYYIAELENKVLKLEDEINKLKNK